MVFLKEPRTFASTLELSQVQIGYAGNVTVVASRERISHIAGEGRFVVDSSPDAEACSEDERGVGVSTYLWRV